jgi:16S rRNA (guanine527-N7)-methyltransferase
VTDRAEQPPPRLPDVEEPPPHAAEVFGANLSRARRYVGLLSTAGVERGMIGPREAGRLWERHVLNSATLASLLPAGASVVDAGSGAGLPGIPLVLARPDLRMTLLEPMARRVLFLTEVVSELGVDVEIRRGRVEDLPEAAFDAVVARAVAPLGRLVTLALPAVRPGGVLLALKGASAAAEIAAARSALRAFPGARVTLVDAQAGPTTATVVVVDLDAGNRKAEDRTR